ERLISNFIKLAGINGVSGQEREIGEELKRQLSELGIPFVQREDGTIIGTVPGTVQDAPTLVLSSHQDTVLPTSAAAIRRSDRKIHTDGTHILGSDNRAGLAQILEAVRVALEQNLERPEIKLVFTVSEEVGLVGAGRLNPEDITERPALGMVVDSTDVRDLNLTNDSVLVNPTRTLKYQYSIEDPVVQLAMASMARGGTRPRPLRVPIMTGAGTDANTVGFNSKHIRTIAIGCGQRDIHTPHENIHLDDLCAVARTLVASIENATDFRVEGDLVVPRKTVA
ncbi:MAG: M20/M25/M40 family metallo-hydrolase, partial [Candidatus Eremiobacterota bacterium]